MDRHTERPLMEAYSGEGAQRSRVIPIRTEAHECGHEEEVGSGGIITVGGKEGSVGKDGVGCVKLFDTCFDAAVCLDTAELESNGNVIASDGVWHDNTLQYAEIR